MDIKMKTAMTDAWVDWHGDMDADDIPAVNPSFREGFEACHDLLMPLLKAAAMHVHAAAAAEHMLDGFRPQRRPADELIERINDVLPNAPHEGRGAGLPAERPFDAVQRDEG